MDLTGDPSPAAKLDGPYDMLAEDAWRPILALAQLHPHRYRRAADDWDARKARPHDDRLAGEHPQRGHQPAARPGGLIEEIFEFVGVDLPVPAGTNANGEAMDRRFGAQRVSPSQKEERSHEVSIGQGNPGAVNLGGRPRGFLVFPLLAIAR